MPGQARVHELAKELGVESKEVLAKCWELGLYVKSASSMMEAPAADRIRQAFPGQSHRQASSLPAAGRPAVDVAAADPNLTALLGKLRQHPARGNAARAASRPSEPSAGPWPAFTPGDERRREAIFAGFAEFGGDGEEHLVSGYGPLPEAPRQTRALADSFRRLGYSCTALEQTTSAQQLGSAVDAAIRRCLPSDVLVVHILSHGSLTRTGALRVIGADGRHHDLTEVERWLRGIVDAAEHAPMTLFLLDICYAGDAARLAWQPRFSDDRSRAWVIAACGPAEEAFGGRFTEAVTAVNQALADGELDLDRSYRYVPITTVAQRIRRAVAWSAARLDRLPQQVTASLVDISAMPAELPFFPNPWFAENPRRDAGSKLDTALRPFLDDLDEALDPAHFLSRAAGHGPLDFDSVTGCFSGRGRELRILSPWLNLQDGVGLRVVTGSPGVGKSALIGVLVCAAHPGLRQHTEAVWHHIEQAPYEMRSFAAVHARKRTLSQVVASIAAQLPEVSADGVSAAGLLDRIAALPGPPVIVVDALDEAVDGETIMHELLLPLSRVACRDGRLVRLLVGVRPWEQFKPLLTSAGDGGGLIDLDRVSAALLRPDIARYVSSLLLADQRWHHREFVGAAHSLAHAVAERLTERSGPQEWGAFLVAGLFTSHVLSTRAEPISDAREALDLGGTVPSSLPDLLDLDLRTRRLDAQVRCVLAALAHAKGEGMPAETIRYLADAHGSTHAMSVPAVLDVLDAVRFYLRHGADAADGTTLYRLFHQGLADHLWSELDTGTVLDRLLRSVEPPGGPAGARWDLATPYVVRHIGEHAEQAQRIDQLLQDAGYLIAADPAVVKDAWQRVSDPATARIREAFLDALADATTVRRTRPLRIALALAAVRHGLPALAAHLADLPGQDPLPWHPLWVSFPAAGAPRTASSVGEHDGELLVATGSADGSLDVRVFSTGAAVMPRIPGLPGRVTAVAIGRVHDRTVVAAAEPRGTIYVHDALTARSAGRPVPTGAAIVSLVVQSSLGRATVAAIGGTGNATIYDLWNNQPWGTLDQRVVSPSAIRVGRRTVWLARHPTDNRLVVLFIDGKDSGLLRHDGAVTAFVAARYGRAPIGITGDVTGELRIWQPVTCRLIGSLSLDAPITDVCCGPSGEVFVTTTAEAMALRFRGDARYLIDAEVSSGVLALSADERQMHRIHAEREEASDISRSAGHARGPEQAR